MNSLSFAIAGRIVRFGRLALNMNRRIFFQTAAALALLLSLTVRAGDWPQFRGPLGNGVAQEDKAPLHWGPTNNVRWKATLPGPGNSSPIVSHGRVFVTCAEDSGKKRNLYCFDRRTGKQLWMQTVEFPIVEPTYPSNPYCGSTPVAEGARVGSGTARPVSFVTTSTAKNFGKRTSVKCAMNGATAPPRSSIVGRSS